ncbi:helicase [Labrys okinawensis]|uniref:Helicase n=1 Tax=Labrys okinawensis TaxID=346911 RepID=A0A2S9QD41_9HYPH|nr:DEAD/DEAH box helicase [Labrys okinawensis]PRH87261.1 helicase [Labrys okinawensis]
MALPSLNPALRQALTDRNYEELTPVQSAVLADDAADRDLLVSAQTGSGKTVAYGVAIARDLLGDDERFEQADAPLALIIAPTRELAIQVERELLWLYQKAGGRVVSCVGGMDPRRERRQLADGAHIVVGTPGRLRDHIERKGIDLSALRAVVLDEADEMLDLGFREDLEFILKSTPDDRRTLLFSATMPKGIVAIARTYQKDALRIEVKTAERGHADIEYRAIRVSAKETEHAVVNLLRLVASPTTIVFCNTRESVRHLHATLRERGFSAVLLSGELGQHERNQALQALRDGHAQICVATDVAARGIDLPNLGLVIHADLPTDAEKLQHRSGRTGRAGRKGISALLVPMSRRRKAEILLSQAGVKAQWMGPPTADEIRALDQQRMLEDPLLTEAPGEEDLAIARLLLENRSAEDIAAALARVYRSRLPEPEEVSDPGDSFGRRDAFDRRDGRRSSRFDRDDRPARFERDDRPPRFEKGERTSRFDKSDRAPRFERAGRFERDEVPPAADDMVLYRLSIGRRNNADPKWLLPMLCRRGGVKRRDIGNIKILDNETVVEISKEAAEHFAVNVRKPDEENIRIQPYRDRGGEEAAHEPKPHRKGPKKPWADEKPGRRRGREA